MWQVCVIIRRKRLYTQRQSIQGKYFYFIHSGCVYKRNILVIYTAAVYIREKFLVIYTAAVYTRERFLLYTQRLFIQENDSCCYTQRLCIQEIFVIYTQQLCIQEILVIYTAAVYTRGRFLLDTLVQCVRR